MEPQELLEFFAQGDRQDHFADKGSLLGVRTLAKNPENEKDLLAAVAERVYQIRCKIVHTKSDGGPEGEVGLLLPNSPEARALPNDIALVRLLEARVITAAASPFNL